MNWILFFLILFLVYLINFFNNIDSQNRKAIKYFRLGFSNMRKQKIEFSSKVMVKYICKILSLPVRDKYYLDRLLEGSIYFSYLYYLYPELVGQLGSKLYWVDVFQEYNINHPKLYISKLDTKITNYHKIDESQNYILKPIYGGLGYGVKLIKGNEISKYLHNFDNFIIQEKMKDCIFKQSTIYRVNTLYTGEVFCMTRQSNTGITTQGGPFINCDNDECFRNNELKAKFTVFLNKLKNLHKTKFDKVICIGWDIMIHCQEQNVDFYCLEGNIFCATFRYADKNYRQYIDEYKKIVNEFYTINGI